VIHAKTVLLNQLLANANDRSWYVSFQESVEGITEEEAFWKPNAESHSIAEIVQHLIYWNEVWQTRYEHSDFKAVQPLQDNAESFIQLLNWIFRLSSLALMGGKSRQFTYHVLEMKAFLPDLCLYDF
jgi:hypothetical protein